MPYDTYYRRRDGRTLTIKTDDDWWRETAARAHACCFVVEIDAEPSAFVGLMERVEEVQDAFEDEVPASRVLEAALYDMNEESVVAALSAESS